jgi:mannonate dehydratase
MSSESRRSIRAGVRNGDLSEARLRYLKQIGAEDVFVDETTEEGPDRLAVATDNVPSAERLTETRERLEAQGLRFAGVHSLSGEVYDEIMFGGEGARRQTEAIKDLLRNMGEAGIPILGYQWNPRSRNVVFSTSHDRTLRGGAETREFDLNALENPEMSEDPDAPEYDEAAFWDRYEAFLEDVLPVAEEAGVRMALHPADPPTVPKLEGIPRLMRSFETHKRAMDLVESDHHGLKLCLGCFSEMSDTDALEVIEYFGGRDEIVFVHFRDVVGTMPRFHETFVDEGNFDEYEVVRKLRSVGFSGVVIPDHVPSMEGDTGWGHRARGWTVGYLQGLLKAVDGEYGL